jgi:putative transposase
MRQKSVQAESPSERLVRNIRRVTRKRHSAEEKIGIVLDGLRGESSIAELCRREGMPRAFMTLDPRSSWRPASAVWQVTRRGRRPVVRSRTFGVRRRSSRRSWLSRRSNCVCLKKHDRGWGRRGMRYPQTCYAVTGGPRFNHG